MLLVMFEVGRFIFELSGPFIRLKILDGKLELISSRLAAGTSLNAASTWVVWRELSSFGEGLIKLGEIFKLKSSCEFPVH